MRCLKAVGHRYGRREQVREWVDGDGYPERHADEQRYVLPATEAVREADGCAIGSKTTTARVKSKQEMSNIFFLLFLLSSLSFAACSNRDPRHLLGLYIYTRLICNHLQLIRPHLISIWYVVKKKKREAQIGARDRMFADGGNFLQEPQGRKEWVSDRNTLHTIIMVFIASFNCLEF